MGLCLDEALGLAKVMRVPLVFCSAAHGNGAVGFCMSRTDPDIWGGVGSIASPFFGSLRPSLAFK